MPDSMTPDADPFARPEDVAAQVVRHLKQKHNLSDDPAEAARTPIDAAMVQALAADKIFHRYLRVMANGDAAFGAFLARLRHALFFAEWTEDDFEEPPIGVMASLVHQFMRVGYVLPEDDEEASWVQLLAKELASVNWRNPPMDRQLQLLRLALYRPLKGLPFETELLLVHPDSWQDHIGALVDDALRSQLMGV